MKITAKTEDHIKSCKNLRKSWKSQKAEGATWRRTGPRPGPARGPVVLYTTTLHLASFMAGGNGFLPKMDFEGSRGGANGAHSGPPGGAPGGPEVTKPPKRDNDQNMVKFTKFH